MHLSAKHVVGQGAKIARAYLSNKLHPKHCLDQGSELIQSKQLTGMQSMVSCRQVSVDWDKNFAQSTFCKPGSGECHSNAGSGSTRK